MVGAAAGPRLPLPEAWAVLAALLGAVEAEAAALTETITVGMAALAVAGR